MNDQLNRYLNRNSLFAQEIEQKFPQVWDVVGEVIQRINTLMHKVREAQEKDKTRKVIFGLWGSIRRYQINSILNIFSRNLDEGLAILRMAAELSRTLKAVKQKEKNYKIWVRGKDKYSDTFQADAKFDLNDSAERRIFDTYNFCSDYGTHGHKTSVLYLEDTITGSEPNLKGVSEVSKYWFISCIPMHSLSLKCIVDPAGEDYFEYDLELTVLETKLLERIQNDPFFTQPISFLA